MAHFGISVTRATDAVTVLKVLRRYTPKRISELKELIGTDKIAISVSEWDYPLDAGMSEGMESQQQRFLQISRELREAGATIKLWYSPHRDAKWPRESVTDEMVSNLMAAHRDQLLQEHD